MKNKSKALSHKLFTELHSFYWERCELEKCRVLKDMYYSKNNRGKPLTRQQAFAEVKRRLTVKVQVWTYA